MARVKFSRHVVYLPTVNCHDFVKTSAVTFYRHTIVAYLAAINQVPKMAANDIAFLDEDLNGECFIAGAEGEQEVLITNNIVLFPHGFPAAGPDTVGEKVTITAGNANDFMKVNIRASIAAGRDAASAAKIAFIRLLAARQGLMSPDFSPAANNVRYNHAERMSEENTEASITAYNADNAVKTAVLDTLPQAVRNEIRKKFTDIVCCVAYIFRVRGHHYREDFRDRYVSLWARCLHRDADLPLSWELLATDALHAIMPGHLDDYWVASANAAKCAGTLIKRLDAAPAGVAGVIALDRGLSDVTMLFPGVPHVVPESYSEFQLVRDQVRASRWGGSVNARFYGAARIRVDEGKIGALASVVMGVYANLAPDSKLQQSNALQRLAEAAPATGGAIGNMARRAVQSDEMNLLGATQIAGRIAPAPGPV